MKILMLNTYDQRGGAARAAWRLFEGLTEHPVEVNLLVQEKKSDHPQVILAPSPGSVLLNPFRPYIDFAVPLIQTRRRILFSTALLPDRLTEIIDRFDPDVVHLNWITGGFVRIETLAAINRPIVWTLHDMWAFTGGCHNTTNCTRYQQECGACPILHSTRENDLSRRVFERKRETYGKIKNLTITTPGSWLANIVRNSPLLGRRKVVVIGNGLDTRIFKPAGREVARHRLHLDPGKKVVLFGAIRATETPLKGFSLLIEALKISDRNDISLIVFGSTGPGKTDISGLNVTFKGPVAETDVLVDLYSAADVVAVPSYQEVFGQAASEAMACGTPVVAFGCTGLLDIVEHEVTGYLAEPYNPADFAKGLQWILEDPARYENLCKAARERAVKLFDISVISGQFAGLYQEVMHE